MNKELANKKKPTISFEIFPPKSHQNINTIYTTIDGLASLAPDWISVTYGAGGSSRDNTEKIASDIHHKYDIPALAHLTCINATREDMRETLDHLKESGVQNILAMRGDVTEEYGVKDFKYANELISFIKEEGYDFNIFAACYPEKHVEAPSLEEDIINLKRKVDAGASALISQLFFDNEAFYSFREKARDAEINVPIIAGIMPITSANQLERMIKMCGASIPKSVENFTKVYGHNTAAMKEAGITYATNQIIDLLANGVDGIHIYTMNQPDVARRIVENIRGVLYALKVKTK